MAAAPKKKSTRSKKTTPKPLVGLGRRQEVLGLILMAIALLVTLALVTYTPADDALARAFTWADALEPGGRGAENALGLVGAALAFSLVRGFLGYVCVLPFLVMGAWGYVIFRHRAPRILPLLTGLTLVGTGILAAFFGWFAITLEANLGLWSGEVGMAVALWMQRVFGTVGSFILLTVLLCVTILLFVDADVQRTLDRFEDALAALRDRFNSWKDGHSERSAERKTERERIRAERQAAREAARAKKDAERESRDETARKAQEREDAKRKQREEAKRRKAANAPAPPPPPAAPRHTPPPPAPPPSSGLFGDGAPSPPAEPEPRDEPGAAPAGPPSMQVQERVREEATSALKPRAAVVPSEQSAYTFPGVDLLDRAQDDEYEVDYDELEENKQVLLDKLETYKIQITDINAIVGPTVTLYELTPAPGVKISRIKSLEDDLAMALAARGIRMIAPIPGKSAIGIEIPNRHREFVRVRDLIATKKFQDTKMELPVPLGKTIEGEAYLIDLAKQPHMLIAGATGSGKSVGVNALIDGLLYACHPANLKFVLIDPKKIELQQYARILDNYIAMPEDATDPIITDFKLALGALQSCEREMERRYDLLSDAMVRGIREYNQKLAKGGLREEDGHQHLPYIVVIVDELADLMMTAGKDIEAPIARLAQMARAVGIHLVLATQRPSVDVITGLIKANFPARVAYQVASKIDSRTIMDQNGAHGLVGNGDLLYSLGSTMVRLQGPFVSIEEVDRVTEFIAEQDGPGPYLLPPAEPEDTDSPDGSGLRDMTDRDELFDDAARIIVHSQQGSVSLLQRKLSVGYSRAARLVDQLEEAGIVGPFEGSKARQVLVPDDATLDALLKGDLAE